MSIRTKFIITFLLISLIPILIIGTDNFTRAKKEIEKTVINNLRVVADLKVDKIEGFFEERLDDIRTTQDYHVLKTSLHVLNKFEYTSTSSEYLETKKILDSQLQTFQRVYEYTDVMITNTEGIIIYRTNPDHVKNILGKTLPEPSGKAFTEGKKGLYVSDIFRDEHQINEFKLLITAPIHDLNQNLAGVIALEVNMAPIYEFIQDTTGLGETGETLIGKKIKSHLGSIGEFGHTVERAGDHAIFLNPLRHDVNAALERAVFFDDEFAFPIQESTQGQDGYGHSIDYRKEPIIAAWKYIPSLDWGLVAKIDTNEALFPIFTLRNDSIIISIVVAILVSLIAFFIAQSFAKPIKKLTEETRRISKKTKNNNNNKTHKKDELTQLTEAFTEMENRLSEQEREKSLFITSASHQIRTPVSGVRFQLAELKNLLKKNTKKSRDLADIRLDEIIGNNARVISITNDLFTILELGEDYKASKPKKIKLYQLVSNIVASFEDEIKMNKLKIDLDIKKNLFVYGEDAWIKTSILNLLDNAIKYSNQKGSIKISAKKDTKIGLTEISISDTGIGIPKKEQIHVFEKLFRAKNSYIKESVGTGLGLTIVKTIIEGHGGNIEFVSEENKGTTFTITLPTKK